MHQESKYCLPHPSKYSLRGLPRKVSRSFLSLGSICYRLWQSYATQTRFFRASAHIVKPGGRGGGGTRLTAMEKHNLFKIALVYFNFERSFVFRLNGCLHTANFADTI